MELLSFMSLNWWRTRPCPLLWNISCLVASCVIQISFDIMAQHWVVTRCLLWLNMLKLEVSKMYSLFCLSVCFCLFLFVYCLFIDRSYYEMGNISLKSSTSVPSLLAFLSYILFFYFHFKWMNREWSIFIRLGLSIVIWRAIMFSWWKISLQKVNFCV